MTLETFPQSWRLGTAGLAISFAMALLAPSVGQASILHHGSAAEQATINAGVAEIELALSEQRYVDAARLLDQAALAGAKDPRLLLLSGQLELAQHRYADALAEFRSAQTSPATKPKALEGEGLTLSLLGRSEEAMTVLQKAVAESPSAWRAWDALGCEYDQRRDWPHAEEAYGQALKTSENAAIVLNNRGYSRILQHRIEDAVIDLVAALQRKPDLAEARTNLRLALAMKGDYGRAIAPGSDEDRAALLNNAGFAAALRGDYAQAEDLLNQAIKARSIYYDRASENLTMVKALSGKEKAVTNDTH